ncbi:acyl-CoA N-acyltransferase [Aspergillus keveii]|jgi:RimJ/RimL family protein N-acetyltransferase|uniref:Acyl-CoA N-acyltransferase n=1 Tax=Aspergillus keveii TaxID=714993 RepID=A0ABR4GB21_9EURO
MPQATLQSARLKFVPLGQEHFEVTSKLDQDAEVMRYIGFGRPLTFDEAKQVHEWLLKSSASVPGQGTWVAYVGDEPIGWWILAPTPLDKDKPTENFSRERSEFGYRLLPEFWGKGYGKEGSKELLRHAFQDLGLNEVFGETMTVNAASRAVMAKCGLTHVDTWFNEYPTPPPGIEEGEVRYRITKEEWKAQQRLQSQS